MSNNLIMMYVGAGGLVCLFVAIIYLFVSGEIEPDIDEYDADETSDNHGGDQ